MEITPEQLAATRSSTVMGTLGIDIVSATAEQVVLKMPVSPAVHQPYGMLHGGVSVVLAETASSIGAWIAAGAEYETAGIEINANHLRPVRDGVVTATSVPVHQGRTTAVWSTEIRDASDRLICTSRCTLAIRKAGTFTA